MKIDQFIGSLKNIEILMESAPVAVGIIEMPTYRFIAATTSYRKALQSRLSRDNFIGREVHDVLPRVSPQAIKSLDFAHESARVSRFAAIRSTDLSGKSSFWTGASLPIFRTETRSLVMGILIDVTSKIHGNAPSDAVQDKKKIDFFVKLTMQELRNPGQGRRMLDLFDNIGGSRWEGLEMTA